MSQVTAYECEECGTLGKASGDNAPPMGWLYVSTQVIGEDPSPAVVFCTAKCRGLHFRPVIRRKGQEDGDDSEEGHST